MEQDNNKNIIWIDFDTNIDKCLASIQDALKKKPEMVYVRMSPTLFPNRMLGLPRSFVKFVMQNPGVKVVWDMFSRDVLLGECPMQNTSQTRTPAPHMDNEWLKHAYDYLTEDKHRYFFKLIIPCWGVKDEVGRMLDSILEQTYQDYHIVCVDDYSQDGTLDVLKAYCDKHPDKITIIQNEKNYGAGESRNIGHFRTMFTIPSEYEWIVDADDYLADKYVLDKIHDYAIHNPNDDVINIGWTCNGKYYVARLGWPIGLPGRVIRPSAYEPGLRKNIPMGNDVYSHFLMFDKVPAERIGSLDYNCYIYPKPGRHINGTTKNMNVPCEIGHALMEHKFQKQIVIDEIMNGRSGTGKWIKNHLKGFSLGKAQRNRKVSILMASFPFRRQWMVKCIEQLIGQCDNFYLWLNEYSEVPSELDKFDKDKLHVVLGDINLKENGRYLFLNKECKDDYCFICDDDINYPQNYVENTLRCFERNGDNIVIAYYIHNTNSFLAEHATDEEQNIFINSKYVGVPHYRFGLGTAAFVPSLMDFKFTYEELVANYDVEMLIGEQCVERGIRIFTPQRKRNFVTFIKNTNKNTEIDKFALHLTGANERTKNTYDYIHRNIGGNKT